MAKEISKLDEALIKWSADNDMGIMCDCSDEGVIRDLKPVFKALFFELVGDEEEPQFGYGKATYGDTSLDHATVIFGRNELRDELRQKVKEL